VGKKGLGMTTPRKIQILPYTEIVGQKQLKLALELAYIAPRIGGVLISGQRGTGKSTAVRAFAQMIYEKLPVTLPINATEDRVIGGWQIDQLMKGEAKEQPGLLEEANGTLLYVDEVNLLDEHIVNLILDVTSTGVLVVQREGLRSEQPVSFTLVGTMNPEEGGLRPQLLDRFGLMVNVTAESGDEQRARVLKAVLAFDEAVAQAAIGTESKFLKRSEKEESAFRRNLQQARQKFYTVEVPETVVRKCVELATEFQAEGHRGDYVMALAARAHASLRDASAVTNDDVKAVASLTLPHRRPEFAHGGQYNWSEADDERVAQILSHD
jgi:magnesium chelatase subunit I